MCDMKATLDQMQSDETYLPQKVCNFAEIQRKALAKGEGASLIIAVDESLLDHRLVNNS